MHTCLDNIYVQNKAKKQKQKLIKADCLNQVIDFIDI